MPKKTAFLVTKPENIFYLTGFSGEGFVVRLPRKNILFTDARYFALAAALPAKNLQIELIDANFTQTFARVLQCLDLATLHFSAEDLTVARQQFFAKKLRGTGVRFVAAADPLTSAREIKTADEIQKIAAACRVTTGILRQILPQIRVGIAERELAEMIHRGAFSRGCDELAFDSIVAFADHAVCPHTVPTARKLKKGDPILFDFGVKKAGYSSDLSRTFFTAEPTDMQRGAYEAVLAAQKSAVAATKSGVTSKELDGIAREKLGEFSSKFTHSLGHGVGLEIHEAPSISSRNAEKLKAGQVITIEPGVYLENEFGIRVEDTLVVEKSGARVLTSFPKRLTVLKI